MGVPYDQMGVLYDQASQKNVGVGEYTVKIANLCLSRLAYLMVVLC
jgi:hypothetical protein